MASGVMIMILSDVLEEEKWSIGTPRAELVKEAASYLLDKAAEPAFDSFSKDLQEPCPEIDSAFGTYHKFVQLSYYMKIAIATGKIN